MKHYYLAGLCAVSALWALKFWAPGPPLGVSTTPERVRILGYDRELFGVVCAARTVSLVEDKSVRRSFLDS